jgi:hypothetical protein
MNQIYRGHFYLSTTRLVELTNLNSRLPRGAGEKVTRDVKSTQKFLVFE